MEERNRLQSLVDVATTTLREYLGELEEAGLLFSRKLPRQPGQRGPSRWLRRQREWLDEDATRSASDEAVEALTG